MPFTASTIAPAVRPRKRVISLERLANAALVLIVALGFALRTRGLDRSGFNEDEVQKINAARAYLHGEFSRNLEHPMLMKSLIAASLAAAGRWNRGVGRFYPLSDEFAVRLPNSIFGALTAVVIYWLAMEFFSLEVALSSALLWSFGPALLSLVTFVLTIALVVRNSIFQKAIPFLILAVLWVVAYLFMVFLQQRKLHREIQELNQIQGENG